MSDTEVVYDDGANTYMVLGEAARDLKDGEALRKLRDVVPEYLWVEIFGPSADEPRWEVVSVDDSQGFGTTFAEAADKCREALT